MLIRNKWICLLLLYNREAGVYMCAHIIQRCWYISAQVICICIFDRGVCIYVCVCVCVYIYIYI